MEFGGMRSVNAVKTMWKKLEPARGMPAPSTPMGSPRRPQKQDSYEKSSFSSLIEDFKGKVQGVLKRAGGGEAENAIRNLEWMMTRLQVEKEGNDAFTVEEGPLRLTSVHRSLMWMARARTLLLSLTSHHLEQAPSQAAKASVPTRFTLPRLRHGGASADAAI